MLRTITTLHAKHANRRPINRSASVSRWCQRTSLVREGFGVTLVIVGVGDYATGYWEAWLIGMMFAKKCVSTISWPKSLAPSNVQWSASW
jgi:hypothetical protein